MIFCKECGTLLEVVIGKMTDTYSNCSEYPLMAKDCESRKNAL